MYFKCLEKKYEKIFYPGALERRGAPATLALLLLAALGTVGSEEVYPHRQKETLPGQPSSVG